jgi:hypothetical protein
MKKFHGLDRWFSREGLKLLLVLKVFYGGLRGHRLYVLNKKSKFSKTLAVFDHHERRNWMQIVIQL